MRAFLAYLCLVLAACPAAGSPLISFLSKKTTSTGNFKVVVVPREGGYTLSIGFELSRARSAPIIIPIFGDISDTGLKPISRDVFEKIDSVTTAEFRRLEDVNPCNVSGTPLNESIAMSPTELTLRHGKRMDLPQGESRWSLWNKKLGINLNDWMKQQLGERAAEFSMESFPKKIFDVPLLVLFPAERGQGEFVSVQLDVESAGIRLSSQWYDHGWRTIREIELVLMHPNEAYTLSSHSVKRMPNQVEVPLFVSEAFNDYRDAVYVLIADQEKNNPTFIEYSQESNQFTTDELTLLGVSRMNQTSVIANMNPFTGNQRPPEKVWLSRYRYRELLQEKTADLIVEKDKSRAAPFRIKIFAKIPAKKVGDCVAGRAYLSRRDERVRGLAHTTAKLTGWSPQDIYKKMGETPVEVVKEPDEENAPWFKTFFQ